MVFPLLTFKYTNIHFKTEQIKEETSVLELLFLLLHPLLFFSFVHWYLGLPFYVVEMLTVTCITFYLLVWMITKAEVKTCCVSETYKPYTHL